MGQVEDAFYKISQGNAKGLHDQYERQVRRDGQHTHIAKLIRARHSC
jgi:hypothetical protein